jgi:hypothetical protein
MASSYDKFYAQNLEQSTAQKPFIQQDADMEQEHKRNIQNVAMQYAQQNKIPYEQSLNLMNARWDNQQKQKAFAIEDEIRGINAHNAALDAGIALRKVDITAPDAAQKISAIKYSLAPYSGTQQADPIFQEADKMINSTKGFERERLAQKAQERATEVESRKAETEARKAQQESPEGVAARAKALQPIQVETAMQETIAREDAAEKLLSAKAKKEAMLHPEREVALRRNNLMMASNIVKGIPLNLVDNDAEITDAKVKWYSATRDKNGKLVANPNGEFRVYENKADKKNPIQIIPKSDLEDARILKASAVKPTTQDTSGVAPDYLSATAPATSMAQSVQPEQGAITSVEPTTTAPAIEIPIEEPSFEVTTPKQAKGFSDENPFTSFIATTKPQQETLEEQIRRLNPEKVKQESDEGVVKSAVELSKIEEEAKRAKEMGADKYKELYGIDPASYAIKWERAHNKMKDALARSIFQEAGRDPQKATELAKERGYSF